LVAGNGMVCHRFCEKLAEYDRARRYRVVVVGEEPRPAYDRVHLTDYFAKRAPEALALGTSAWYAERGVELRVGTRVSHVDRTRRRVTLSDGASLPYDVLVLATGSSPFVPSVAGIDQAGVFVYRTIEDLDGIAARAATARKAVVIGGGLTAR
jgi:nitrite reductase (NADH) large subunit